MYIAQAVLKVRTHVWTWCYDHRGQRRSHEGQDDQKPQQNAPYKKKKQIVTRVTESVYDTTGKRGVLFSAAGGDKIVSARPPPLLARAVAASGAVCDGGYTAVTGAGSDSVEASPMKCAGPVSEWPDWIPVQCRAETLERQARTATPRTS
jgi:hypothetical protein